MNAQNGAPDDGLSADTYARAAAGSKAACQEFGDRRPRSRELAGRGDMLFAAGVNHNIRATRPFPLYYRTGEGPYRWDVDGNRYVDYQMGAASLILGHAYKPVTEALRHACEGYTPACCTEYEIEWAELVRAIIPCAEKTRFVSSGTEATMLALRLARAFTGREKIMRFEGHYHGWHDQVLPGYRPPFALPGSAGIPASVLPNTVVMSAAQPRSEIERRLASGDIAAVILEPSGASWGTVPLPSGFLQFLRQATNSYGTSLIFDEIITGFRFTPGGVQACEEVTPDLATLGKILTGGLPGGAVSGRADILDLLDRRHSGERYVFHYGTFNGHPLSAAAGIATLLEVRTGEVQRLADAHAQQLRTLLGEILRALSVRGKVYGESSTFHLYLEAARGGGSQRTRGCVDGLELLSIPPVLVDALQCELRLRGLELMSYTGGVASMAHGPAELELAGYAFEGALRAVRDRGLLATE